MILKLTFADDDPEHQAVALRIFDKYRKGKRVPYRRIPDLLKELRDNGFMPAGGSTLQ